MEVLMGLILVLAVVGVCFFGIGIIAEVLERDA